MPKLTLKDFPNNCLYSNAGLKLIDDSFLARHNLNNFVSKHRSSEKEYDSNFLLKFAPLLEQFIAEQFFIEDQCEQNFVALNSHQPIISFKKIFVIKHARKLLTNVHDLPSWDEIEHWRQSVVPAIKDQEWATADYALKIANDKDKKRMITWCARALFEKPALVDNWIAFKLPKKLDFASLIDTQKRNDIIYSKRNTYRQGFDYTDKVITTRELQDQANYCVICHPKQGDFCRIGFPVKKGLPEYKTNPVGNTLLGCPLEQHISEMNQLMQLGHPIAALAVAMINNPMIAATGNRICHDCMSSCIYQKQEPVDIPSIESAILDMVLNLPWGVEIYYLLCRWNPFRVKQWLPKDYNGHKVAVMGMGPAGFTMAHHLLMDGCAVVGLDGQAFSNMPVSWLEPIYCYQDIKSSLTNRSSTGFGGVAEYGITARWDKNLLSVLRIVLERREYFQCFSSVRFGGNWNLSDAWRQGFSHVVLAVGAGLPNVPNIPGSLAPGMRTANDFLMALHLGNAASSRDLASLEVRLPALVIGGGLTAVDTATELQAFYLILVERVANVFSEEAHLKEKLFSTLSEPDIKQVELWLEHGLMLQAAKRAAIATGQKLNTVELLHAWGGVKVVYRKDMIISPAYRENHLELANAMAEGVMFVENLTPKEIILDQDGLVSGLKFENQQVSEKILAAKSVWTAIGTKLNVAYSFEHPNEIAKNSHFDYRAFRWSSVNGLEAGFIMHCKDGNDHSLPIFTSVNVNAGVSFIGDTHPAFHGSVVKAMASAKRSYSLVVERLLHLKPVGTYADFRSKMELEFATRVISKDGPWVTILAPQIARNWRPGMFCRLFGSESRVVVPVASKNDTITVFEKELDLPEVGQFIALMGPAGVRYNIDERQLSRLWFVDDSGLAFVLSLLSKIDKSKLRLVIHSGPSLDKKVLAMLSGINWQMAGVNTAGAWSCMPHEQAYYDLLRQYTAEFEPDEIAMFTAPTMTIAIKSVTTKIFNFNRIRVMAQAVGPMQCALKGVCAQCLQWQVDPVTKARTKAVYSCSWQHQPLELIDLQHAKTRFSMGRLLKRVLATRPS